MSALAENEALRCDVLLVRKGLAPSRERARALIEAGCVFASNRKIEKPSALLTEDADLEVRGEVCPYVSRGAFKLLRALEIFGDSVEGVTALDVGASTGGFTDVLLRNGAKRVYAVDVGTAQLAPSLLSDPRVVSMEKTNARTLTREMFPERPELIVMDVSFISILKLLPALGDIAGESGRIITLVKPQFEAGRAAIGKHGVVSSPAAHERVLKQIVSGAWETGWQVVDLTWSPIRGGEGNIEFLAGLIPFDGTRASVDDRRIQAVVREAHDRLKQ